MLMRLVGKMLFKVTVPLIALAGIFTYGMYMRGGDPGALWQGVWGNTVAQVSNVFSDIGDDAVKAAGALSGSVTRAGTSADDAGLTTVYRWQDANGVTHFSSVEPDTGTARSVTVDPNVNIVAPVRSRPASAFTDVGEQGLAGAASRAALRERTTDRLSPSQQSRPAGRADGHSVDPGLQEVREQLGGTLPGVAGQVLSTSSGAAGGTLQSSQLIRMLQQ